MNTENAPGSEWVRENVPRQFWVVFGLAVTLPPSFLLLNSVALHGDGCPICQAVETELIRLSGKMNCSLQVRLRCCLGWAGGRVGVVVPGSHRALSDLQNSGGGSAEGCGGSRLYPPSPPVMLQVNRPAQLLIPPTQLAEEELVRRGSSDYRTQSSLAIERLSAGVAVPAVFRSLELCIVGNAVGLNICFVAQHYPLYRVSDAGCTGLDAAPAEDRHLLFREKYDVLSKEASQRVRAAPPPG